MNKNFILNADDFGMSEAFNKAVFDGTNSGILTSASICANGDAFDSAINDIIPKCPNLSLGVHLNIIEGKSLTNCQLLTDENGYFNNGYIAIMLKSFNKDFMEQVEQEFRAQIEKTIKCANIDHIDSHVHTHAIPNIFKLSAKLAKEYNIPYIRTQKERMYIVPSLKKILNLKYFINILKILLLNTFTAINTPIVKKYNLRTNDYIIGVGYTGMMDELTVEHGLKALNKNCIAEALIHPCKYDTENQDSHHFEYLLTQSENLRKRIEELGFKITSHSNVLN